MMQLVNFVTCIWKTIVDDVALVSSTRDQLQRKSSDLSIGCCQTTGLEHDQQEEDQDNAAYRYTITSELENEDLEEVEKFTYLGSVMTKSNATQCLVSATVWCRMLEGYTKRQPESVRFPHIMPEKDMQDILAPEDHKQETLSQDTTTGHKAKKMEVAWAC
ncbi:hypothetical protein ACROYT_G018564 [Oculina patagonica]